MPRPAAGTVSALALAAALVVAAPAEARTTLGCAEGPSSAPATCTVYTLPGPVVRGPAVRLSGLRWSRWGSRRATARGRLLRGGRRVRVRIVADQRVAGVRASFYSRVTLVDVTGARQRINLDEITEQS